MTKLLATDGEGERLDRYELIAELASGGMATVFLARNTGVAGFQRLVAIKRLHPHLAREAEFVEMFLDEARLAARIHHPNVVPILEVGESSRGYYLVMDYVEGDTLARLLARSSESKQPIPFSVAIRILLDTLAGLHAAHEMTDDAGHPLEIVHRDVSPQNILVGLDGISRITDFGVARAASRLSTTRSGQLKGKLSYMAPEQARGGAIDRRADVFSCGIVLWEALALKRLFRGGGEAETLNRVLYDAIAPPSSARPDVPRVLDDVCMKALERELDLRFPTASAMADALEGAAQGISALGSVRDVASCVEEVVGDALVQQRDAVRAWLARSEPTAPRPASIPPRDGALLDSAKTRIEGVVSTPPEKVSSVSSTVLQVSSPADPAPPAGSRDRTRGRRLAAVAAVAVVAGALGFGASRLASPGGSPGGSPAVAGKPGAPPVAERIAEPPPSEPASAAAPPAPTGSSTAAAASSEAREPAGPPATRAAPTAPSTPSTSSAAASGSSAPVQAPPDDLSHNPYR